MPCLHILFIVTNFNKMHLFILEKKQHILAKSLEIQSKFKSMSFESN